VLALGAVGAYFAAKWVDKEVAQAQAAEKLMVQYQKQAQVSDQQAQTANQQYLTELASHNADRVQWGIQQAKLLQAYTTSNQAVNQQIQQAVTPGKSAQDVYADLHGAFKDNPIVEGAALNVSTDPTSKEQLLTFSVPVVQQITATKLNLDLQLSNVGNLNQQLSLEKQANLSLTSDLTGAQTALTATQSALKASQTAETQCEVTVKDYKKVVLPSKFKRIMGGALKGVIFVAGAALGHYL
jgi:hypothetical protein